MKEKAAASPVMQTLATYIAKAGKKPLPKPVMEKTKHHVLDTIAAMVSGSRLLPGEKAISFIKTQGGTPEATVIGSRIVTSAVNAAHANGMLGHADETDDSHAPSLTHPGCGIVPAALAMAEREGCGGTAFLRAVTLGIRRRLPHDDGAARVQLPRSRAFDAHLRADVRCGRGGGLARGAQVRPGPAPALVHSAADLRRLVLDARRRASARTASRPPT